ncbi:alpha/beta hydrolase [Bradyrhizobium sp. LHD-71]|uniref:alpha/beta fold hydrolase n=1 Tax=Bradyrhizobium sp. LHD-71 TaxID=3072141 RepID=UPI00280EB53D|nr:alpha/beta hydrolase [Bradyrhizobium sp. LHD-71]MDQ8728709.1 alpha/beta hydrolase [Bradyrhizobium sp. LHD-71]
MIPQIKSTKLPTGVTVEFIEHGAATGAPLLLLHGLSDSWHSFLPLLPHLPQDVRALAFSQRGHGQSAKPRTGYSLDALTEDARAFLDAMHIDRAVVAGHSMGAAVAMMFAAAYPDRVAALALLGAFADLRTNVAVIALRKDVQDLSDPIDPAFAHAFQVSTTVRMIDDDFIDLVVSDSQALPSSAWRSLTEAFITSDLPATFTRIKAPARLIWGDQDVFVPRSEQDTLLSGVPHATLHVLEDTGHAVHWDKPGKTAGIIGSLMRDAAGRLPA